MKKDIEDYLDELQRAVIILENLENDDLYHLLKNNNRDIRTRLTLSLIFQSCIEVMDYIEHMKEVHSQFSRDIQENKEIPVEQ